MTYRYGEKVYTDCWNDYTANDCVHIISATKSIMALLNGNVIYVNPAKELVVAVASYFKPTVFDRGDFIREYMELFICE